jgi:NAD(P)H-dependent flavin oxidoreductase YrpB (nitropropane dioxygenase family)
MLQTRFCERYGVAAPIVVAPMGLGSVEAAVRARQAGVDMIIAQGVEAGGHVAGEVSTIVLLPRIVDAVAPTLVLAAGGIANARGLPAALCLGADGVVMGTRFLATGDIESMSLLAGESVGLINEIRPAAEILRETVSGAERLIRELSAKVH